MNNQTKPQKTYAPMTAKEITTSLGTLMKLSFHAGKMIEFIRQHANEKGYVNMGMSPRREVGQYGETHSVWLDTWKPTQQGAAQKPKAEDDDVGF